ncbi:MAG: DNA-binding protein [Microbacterium sp.]|nr:DNA-binding protein [Microbacterium sp.]MEC8647931.1 YlxR family protein [Actinomycetota bacterium]MEE3088828.1 YlxR family protein [Actinomycetota bacterium]HBF26900.1 DUF448 domain-containing protein [Actinomycetota bacterium]
MADRHSPRWRARSGSGRGSGRSDCGLRRRIDVAGSPPEPTRQCIGCRSRAPRSSLVRLVADASAPGGCRVDRGRNQPGRGAHIHPREECVDEAAKRRALPRALRALPGSSVDISQVRAEILGTRL